MKDSHFRRWVNDMWFQHKDEHFAWCKEPCPYTASHYFNKYKWWLVREYKYQHREDKV